MIEDKSLVAVEPKVSELEARVGWNFDEVKAYIEGSLQKYSGLVVTDQNVKDMERTRREVGSYRTGITKFRAAVKKKMKEPIDVFSRQCDELLGLVQQVEAPIQEQLDVHEEQRIEGLTKRIEHHFEESARESGLREEFWAGFQVQKQWLNRTWRWSDTESDIASAIKSLLSEQEAADTRAALFTERRNGALAVIDHLNEKYDLATPLTEKLITPELLEKSLQDIRTRLGEEAAARHGMEVAARQKAEQETDKRDAAWNQRVQDMKSHAVDADADIAKEWSAPQDVETVMTVKFYIRNQREGEYVQKHLDQIQQHVRIEMIPEA